MSNIFDKCLHARAARCSCRLPARRAACPRVCMVCPPARMPAPLFLHAAAVALRDKITLCRMGLIFHIFAARFCGVLLKLFLLSSPISHTIPTSAASQRCLPKLPLFPQRGFRSRRKNNEAIALGLALPFSEKPNASCPRYLFVSIAQKRLTNNARYGTIEP